MMAVEHAPAAEPPDLHIVFAGIDAPRRYGSTTNTTGILERVLVACTRR
jgi:hypothetical protein